MLRKILLGLIAGLICGVISYGQFADCSTGLLQAPTAEMQPDGTFMITNNFLNKHSLPSGGWNYNSFQYGLSITLWGRIEIGYVCTLFNGSWDTRPDKDYRESIMRNQDRHFVGRVCLLKEGEFGLNWMPALVVGISDPTTGASTGNYGEGISRVSGDSNGYFNRNYAVLSKHFYSQWGLVGVHVGYQYNHRLDYSINGPCAGINWQPVWLQEKGLLDKLSVIAEYDARTVNLGLIASLFNNRMEAMFELQNLRWVNFGLRYKLIIKKVI